MHLRPRNEFKADVTAVCLELYVIYLIRYEVEFKGDTTADLFVNLSNE